MWFCFLPNLKLLTDYIINVTAVSPGGSSSYLSSFMLEEIGENSTHGDDHGAILTVSFDWSANCFLSLSFLSVVKPDPPVDVRVSPRGTRNLLVEWSPPPSWANLDILPLKYQILYQWENRGTPKSVNVRMLFHLNTSGYQRRQQQRDFQKKEITPALQTDSNFCRNSHHPWKSSPFATKPR